MASTRGLTNRFTVSAEDGVRLWVDDRVLIDRWQDQAATYSAEISAISIVLL